MVRIVRATLLSNPSVNSAQQRRPQPSGHDAIDAFVEEFTSMRRGLAFSAKGSVTHKTPSE